jgi:hypothetical protein
MIMGMLWFKKDTVENEVFIDFIIHALEEKRLKTVIYFESR